MASCKTCRFFLTSGEQGLCRRLPPVPIFAPGSLGQPADIYSIFPTMKPDGWCGEFQPQRSDVQ